MYTLTVLLFPDFQLQSEFDSSKLLNIVTSPTNPCLNSQPIIESDTELSPPNSTPMDIDDFADPYEIPNKDKEWGETVAVSRKQT